MGVKQGLASFALIMSSNYLAVAQQGAPHIPGVSSSNIEPKSDPAILSRYQGPRERWDDNLPVSQEGIARVGRVLDSFSSTDARTATNAISGIAAWVDQAYANTDQGARENTAAIEGAQDNVSRLAGQIIDSVGGATEVQQLQLDRVYRRLLTEEFLKDKAALSAEERADENNPYNQPFDAQAVLDEHRSTIAAYHADHPDVVAITSQGADPTIRAGAARSHLEPAARVIGGAETERLLIEQLTDQFGAERAAELASQAMGHLSDDLRNAPAADGAAGTVSIDGISDRFTENIESPAMREALEQFTQEYAQAKANGGDLEAVKAAGHDSISGIRNADTRQIHGINGIAQTAEPANPEIDAGRPDYTSDAAKENQLNGLCDTLDDVADETGYDSDHRAQLGCPTP